MDTGAVSLRDTDLSEARRPVRQPAKISLFKAMNQFFDRDDDQLKLGTRIDYNNAFLLFQQYINTFGSVLLRAAEIPPAFARPKDGSASEHYDTASTVKLFRGFVIFFLRFKVNAPEEIKKNVVRIIEEFVEWLRTAGHLPEDFQSNLEEADSKSNYLALHAFNLVAGTIAHGTKSTKHPQDIHDYEPIYVVSRVKSGKIWVIYVAEGTGYDELGPVSVSRGVSDILKPGWLVDCAFGRFDGKWQITKVRNIMPA